jgi:hypothetical protein
MSNIATAWVLSKDGRDFSHSFCDMFSSTFGYLMPSAIPSYSNVLRSFEIPEWETIDGLKNAITESVVQKRDLLIDRYSKYEIPCDPRLDY